MTATMEAGCGSKDNGGSSSGDDGTITLKVFSNLPDRKNGQGLVEQMIIDEYMEEKLKARFRVYLTDPYL